MVKRLFEVKYFTLFLTFVIQCIAFSQNGIYDDHPLNRQIVTSAQLKEAGLVNISDVLLLAENWHISTLDGFSWLAVANNLSTFQRQNFIVMIDGQKFDASIFDVQSLNVLPITIGQIDYVEFINTPQIYEGEFTDKGLIHFHTNRPANNLSVQGNYNVGDVTGDPGPYRYTQYSTPNVDKIGHNYSFGASYGTIGGYLEGNFKGQDFFSTNEAINKRISGLYNYYNKMSLYAGSIKFGSTLLEHENLVFTGYSSHKDFYFFKPYGREIPVQRDLIHTGLNGTIPFNKFSLRYRFNYTKNILNEWENKLNINFDWQKDNFHANAEGKLLGSWFQLYIGGGIDSYNVKAKYQLSDNKNLLPNGYFRFDYRLSRFFSQSVNLYSVKVNKKISFKGSFMNSLHLGDQHSLLTTFSYSERQFEEDNNYWFWFTRGYNFINDIKVDYKHTQESNRNRQISIDLKYVFKIKEDFNLIIAGNYRYFNNLYLEYQLFEYEPIDESFSSPIKIFPERFGGAAGGQIAINYKLTRDLNQMIFYSYQQDITGDEIFRNIWKSLPRQNFSYTISFMPNANFGVWARVKHISSSYWSDYAGVESRSNGKYSARLRPKTILDISIQKWFWKRKVWTSILFRNVLNQTEVYHPIGATLAFRFYIHVQVYFNSII
jgi:hypothetical protein